MTNFTIDFVTRVLSLIFVCDFLVLAPSELCHVNAVTVRHVH